MTHARPLRPFALAGLALLLAGCAPDSTTTTAYLWPTPFSADPPPRSFAVRYSDFANDPAELKALIAKQCGPETLTARVFDHRHSGTLFHPHQMDVVCGDPPPRTTDRLFVKVDQGELIRLTDPPSP